VLRLPDSAAEGGHLARQPASLHAAAYTTYGEARRRRVHINEYDILKKRKKTRKHFIDISLNMTKNDLGTTLLY
jgi:hypothetical protein